MDYIYKGIDVSRWQGVIDWAKVKAAGIGFAFIRAGYCGYVGDVTTDLMFEANMKNAAAAGVETGVYLYSYAKTPAAAARAARETLALIGDYTLRYPVALDMEDTQYQSMSKAENTAISKAFLETVAEAGYCPLLYTYKAFATGYLDMTGLAEYDFWLAHITSQTNYTGPYTVWQYSWSGAVDGITGDVDLNYCYKDYPAFIVENGLNGFAPGETEDDSGGDPGDTGGEDTGEQGGEEDSGTAGPELPEAPATTYTVVKNDNLTRIAKAHGVTLQALIQANPQIKDPNLIYVGDIINVPAK